MSGLQPFDLDTLPDEPWRNGGGRTRPIASDRLSPNREPIDEGSLDADWRLSVATIDGCGPFSVFPGVDRHSLLLTGGPLALASPGRPRLALRQAGDVVSYDGESAWHAELGPDGEPAQLLNLMTRRAAARGRLRAVDADAELTAGALAVLAIAGQWSVRDARGGPAMIRSARTGATSPPWEPPLGEGSDEPPHRWIIQRLSPTGLIATLEVEPT